MNKKIFKTYYFIGNIQLFDVCLFIDMKYNKTIKNKNSI